MIYQSLALMCLYIIGTSPIYSDTITTKIEPKGLPEEITGIGIKRDKNNSHKLSPQALKQKANDYKKAFKVLKQQNPAGKIYMIVSGQSIDKIDNIKVMPEGTLIMLTIRTNRGFQTRVINTADISEIGMH